MLEAARLDEVVDSAVEAWKSRWSPSTRSAWRRRFNAFYHRQQIMREEREDARLWRAAGVVYFTRQLTRALDLMGCAVPPRM
jgi:hypothetical protein